MLWKRILFHYNRKRVSDPKKSIIRRRRDRKNSILKATEIGRGDKNDLGKQKKRRRSVESNDDNKVRKKRKITGNNGFFDRNTAIDRISELPESIIHHIFSFLRCTKDMVRTTVLSKNWKRMIESYNSFDFNDRWFKVRGGKGKHNRIKAREVQKKKFKNYVDKSIATRFYSLATVDKFRLCVNNVDGSMINCIIRWIYVAVEKKVKELDIQVNEKRVVWLTNNVFVSESITSLKLSGFILYNFSGIKMCNLRELSIKDSRLLSENVMKKFEYGCPLLEDLRIVCCPEISCLTISSLVKLRRVEVQDCVLLNRIEIAAKNLASFWYHAERKQQCEIELKGSENLKNLTLKDRMMTDSAFEDWIAKHPLLEKLVLHECTNLEKIKIFSVHLKSLALIRCEKLCEANIDAPNLYSFEYNGHMIPFHSMNISSLREAKFSFHFDTKKNPAKRHLWTFDYQNFFGNFDESKGFKLIVYSKQNMKILEEPEHAPEVRNNFCKLHVTTSLTRVVKTVDDWLRECHGMSLTVVSSNSELRKLIDTMIMEREDHPSCCRFYSNKCWRHYMADVKISSPKTAREIHYDFTWRSRNRKS